MKKLGLGELYGLQKSFLSFRVSFASNPPCVVSTFFFDLKRGGQNPIFGRPVADLTMEKLDLGVLTMKFGIYGPRSVYKSKLGKSRGDVR